MELPVERVWLTATRVARQAVRRASIIGPAAADVTTVLVHAFRPGLVLLDRVHRPLLPIWLPGDGRARPAARQVQAHVGAEFEAAFGYRPTPDNAAAVHWRQQLTLEPYLSHRVRFWLDVTAWIALRATGRAVCTTAAASTTGLCLPGQSVWSPRWCDYFDVELRWLPSIVPPGTTVGNIAAAVAHELGVPAGIPLLLGD
ncbi:MAG: FGGY family carbohydrate kinase [Gemmataceae bacterium]|nr:FGGY family carbohydrate kinase [Gemmataceae bacterium]